MFSSAKAELKKKKLLPEWNKEHTGIGKRKWAVGVLLSYPEMRYSSDDYPRL